METVNQNETAQVLSYSVNDLATKLAQEAVIELTKGSSLVIKNIVMSDFMTLVEIEDQMKKVQYLAQILSNYGLVTSFEGSVALGQFNLDDLSWTLLAGDTGSFKIKIQPMPLRRSISDLVSFLKKLPLGQAIVFPAMQELYLEGFSSDQLMNYYTFCQNNKDLSVQQKGQDALFNEACKDLKDSGKFLRIVAISSTSLDRQVNAHFGGIVFKASHDKEMNKARIAIALVEENS